MIEHNKVEADVNAIDLQGPNCVYIVLYRDSLVHIIKLALRARLNTHFDQS
ncbi:hypothetical protein D3C81_2155240 [compost metagenome]